MGHALSLFPSKTDSLYDQVIHFYDLKVRRIFVNLLVRAIPPVHSSERGDRLQARRAWCSPADGQQGELILFYTVASAALHRIRNSALLREGLPPLAFKKAGLS